MLPPMPEQLYRLHHLACEASTEPLFAVLAAQVPGLSRHQARIAIQAGLLKVDGSQQLVPTAILGEGGHRLELDLRQGVRRPWVGRKHDAVPVKRPFSILHHDRMLLVVDKAAGVMSAPTTKADLGQAAQRGHLPELIRRTLRKQGHKADFIGLIHRLDRDTSGCICFALAREAQRILSAQFAGDAAGRTYRCLVRGTPGQESGELRGKQGRDDSGHRAIVGDEEPGVEAVTTWRVVRRHAAGAELEIELGTGRTHQVRVALAHLGLPVWGDRVYGPPPVSGEPRPPRLMLHAVRLSLDHPADGRRLVVDAPPPEDYRSFALELAKAPAQAFRPLRRPERQAARRPPGPRPRP